MPLRKALNKMLALLAASCSDGSTPDPRNIKPEEAQVLAQALAEDVVSPLLRDPESAEFTHLQIFSETDERPIIVCGFVNARNGFGGMTGPKRFVAGGTVALEQQIGPINMNRLWAEFCRSS